MPLLVPTPPPCNATSYPVPAIKNHRKITDVEILFGHKHVTVRVPGVGLVTLLQDQNCILHVEVFKVNPEVCTTQCPTQAPLYQALEPKQEYCEGYPVNMGHPGV